MNRKTVLIALLALAVAAAGAFASGKKEEREYGRGFYGYGPGPGGCPGYGPGMGWARRGGPRGAWGPDQDDQLKFSEDKVTVTGPLYFQQRLHPEVKADGKTYELMVPRFYLYDLELKDGQEVTVEGYAAAGDEESYLWVTQAVINGKTYELERGPRGGRGPGFGGPGFGWMHGGPRGW
jgi:hypothetical protein